MLTPCLRTDIDLPSSIAVPSHGKSERSDSPNTMNDEDRRELLARQHKALYGESTLNSNNYGTLDNQHEDKTALTSKNHGVDSGANSTASPVNNNQQFGTFDSAAQQSSRTSTSSPGNSSPPRAGKNMGAPAPIGTRPAQATNPALNKRTTPPTSSPLTFGFAGEIGDRAASAASNPQASTGRDSMTSSGNWGTGSGVWGKGSLTGVSSTVWG